MGAAELGVFAWPAERPHYATVRRIVDGDTIHVDIDMDLKVVLLDYPLRLAGCNAAPISTPSGVGAAAYLSTVIPPGTLVVLLTIKDYKYGGEYIARVLLQDGTDVVAQLIAQQWAAPWDGRGPQPLPPWPRTVT